MIEESQTKLSEALESIDLAAVESYLGRYSNDVLGEVTLAWDGDVLLLDVGEFQSEIRAGRDDDGEPHYTTFAPPLACIPLGFGQNDAGDPVIIYGVGVVEYPFGKID